MLELRRLQTFGKRKRNEQQRPGEPKRQSHGLISWGFLSSVENRYGWQTGHELFYPLYADFAR